MNYHFIINTFHSSTTYLLEVGQNEWVIVDPGWSHHKLDEWIVEKKPRIMALILTHEHADHCAGTNRLSRKYNVPLFCTSECKKGIAGSKQNLSLYIDDIPAFVINVPTIAVSDRQKLKLGYFDFTFVTTPGHSPGSMCIISGNTVITGDTLLLKTKTPLNFPHSNKTDYAKSVEKLKTNIFSGMTIFPGHGEPFILNSWEQFYF